jgi:integrase
MFVHAISHGWLKRDQAPTGLLPRWQERSRQRALSLAELGADPAGGAEDRPQLCDVIRLLILTGCRRSEIADLRWSEVDFAEALISLPGSR